MAPKAPRTKLVDARCQRLSLLGYFLPHFLFSLLIMPELVSLYYDAEVEVFMDTPASTEVGL